MLPYGAVEVEETLIEISIKLKNSSIIDFHREFVIFSIIFVYPFDEIYLRFKLFEFLKGLLNTKQE